MLCSLCWTVCILSGLLADEANQAEISRLEGTWQLVSATTNGEEMPADKVAQIRIVIKDGRHSVFFGEAAVAKDISFTIDPSTTPKATTDKLPDGREIRGIYRLEADKLISCVSEPGGDRPKEFASRTGARQTLRVFQRAPVAKDGTK